VAVQDPSFFETPGVYWERTEMSTRQQSKHLPDAWMEMLNDIEQAIGQTLEKLAARIEADAKVVALADAEERSSAPTGPERLAKLNDLSPDHNSILKRLEHSTGEADAELQRGEESLRRWLEASKGIARRLAKWGGI
jgi:hypothetical protein